MGDYKEIVVYLTQKQAEQANQWIIQRTKAYQKSEETKNYIYVCGDNYREWIRNKALLPWLNAGDLNQEVYPTTHSKAGEPVPSESQYIAKINEWVGYGYLKEEEAEKLKDILLKSSGSYQENEWIYSISGTDNGRNEEETRLILDIHDRRLDDPNTTLEIKGNVIIGNVDNPEDRKKFTVLGETEVQDATGFGRVTDTYGEQNPDQWGHQIPDEAFPKVYINRGEDRFNGEVWANGSYGEGFGTVEATREIVSHTTINADRGIIIEDGLGDETDYEIKKKIDSDTGETIFCHDIDEGEREHNTNGAALTINHDGFNVKGHSFIKDEVDKNKFYSKNEAIYSINAEDNSEVECTDIEKNCWFCTEDEETNLQRDQQYGNWCIQEDGSVVLITDQWPGFLYHIVESTRNLIPTSENPKENEKIYVYYGTDGKQYCFTYNAEANTWTQREILNEKPQEVNGYYTISNNYYFYKTTISEVKMEVIYVNTQDNPAKFNLKEGTSDLDGTFTADVTERVNPEIKKVYQIKEGYIWDSYPVGNKTRKQVTHEGGEFANGDYLYWDGIYFRKVENTIDNDFSAGYGSFTIGTSASVDENGKDKIGQHALEVGTNVAAEGKNSVAMGDGTTAKGENSVAIGNDTTAEANNSVVIGSDLTNNTEDSLMIGGKSGDGHALSIHNSAGETAYITHNGSEKLNRNLEVKGTSNLKGKTTIGEEVDAHSLALEVKHHSQFDEQVEVTRDSEDVDTADYLYPEDIIEQKNSLKVRGTSLFNDKITVGYDKESEEQPGTFWGNFDDTIGQSNFIGLEVHGEIKNERIPMELYTSTTINGNLILNEFADKFFVNSSIATATATFRGNFSPVEYGYELYTGETPEEYQTFLSLEETPYPYLEANEVFAIGPDEEEEYTFYKKRNFNPKDKQAVIEWLNNYNYTSYTTDKKVETYFDLPSAKEHLGQIYEVLETIEFYKSIEIESSEGEKIYEWKKLISPPDKNDYCYFQIVDKKGADDNVLFAEKYEDDNNILASPNETSPYPVEIICWRFKFVEFLHPTTHDPSDRRTWQFEYQLNNSGFTWEQWSAINSGISGAWMKETRGQIVQEAAIREQNDNALKALIENTTNGIVIKGDTGDKTHFIYLEKEENSSNEIQRYITKQCEFELQMTVGDTPYNGDKSYPAIVFTNNQNETQYGYNDKLFLPKIEGTPETLITDQKVTEKLNNYVLTSTFNSTLLNYCYSVSSVGDSDNPIYLVKNDGKLIPQPCGFKISTTQNLTVDNFIGAYNNGIYMPNTNFVLPVIQEQLQEAEVLATENYVGTEITKTLSNYALKSYVDNNYALKSYVEDTFITTTAADDKYAFKEDVLAALSKGNIIFGTAELEAPEGKPKRAVAVFGDKQEDANGNITLTLLSIHIDPGNAWFTNTSAISYKNYLQRFFNVEDYNYSFVTASNIVHTSTGVGGVGDITWNGWGQKLSFKTNTNKDVLIVFSMTLNLTKKNS